MLFVEDSLKGWKKEWKAAGVDMSQVKTWQRSYDKVRKTKGQLEAQYTRAKQELQQVHAVLKSMEQSLIAMKGDWSNTTHHGSLGECVRELKKYQNCFNHEFLIGKEDKEFHLTYTTILQLVSKGFRQQKDVLIVQSEVENILAVTEEALEKHWPDFRALAYFYLERTDREILDLPHADKVAEVERIYQDEFIAPMRQTLTKCLDADKVNKILEVDVWS